MATLFLGTERPRVIQELIEERQRTGVDTHDEVWEGVYYVAPATHGFHGYIQSQLVLILSPLARARNLSQILEFNLGAVNDFRVPDLGILRQSFHAIWFDTAALVVEIVSPGDTSWDKFGFYAAYHVDEVVIVDPWKRTVDWFALSGDRYEATDRSVVIELGASELRERIDWPPLS